MPYQFHASYLSDWWYKKYLSLWGILSLVVSFVWMWISSPPSDQCRCQCFRIKPSSIATTQTTWRCNIWAEGVIMKISSYHPNEKVEHCKSALKKVNALVSDFGFVRWKPCDSYSSCFSWFFFLFFFKCCRELTNACSLVLKYQIALIKRCYGSMKLQYNLRLPSRSCFPKIYLFVAAATLIYSSDQSS